MKIIRVELKYCEYCGGLLLRAAGDNVIYCRGCARKIAELPPAGEDSVPRTEPTAGPDRGAYTPAVEEELPAGDASLTTLRSPIDAHNSPECPTPPKVDLDAVADCCSLDPGLRDGTPPPLPPCSVRELTDQCVRRLG